LEEEMKTDCILVPVALLVTATMGYARSSAKSQSDRKIPDPTVQASPDNPDRKHKGSVTGTVVDELGKPVNKATVELTDVVTEEAASSVTTGDNGRYEFSGLLPGNYRIHAKKGEKESEVVEIKVDNDPVGGPRLVLKASK
jgi:uncharacterized GH25 family protein